MPVSLMKMKTKVPRKGVFKNLIIYKVKCNKTCVRCRSILNKDAAAEPIEGQGPGLRQGDSAMSDEMSPIESPSASYRSGECNN